MRYTIIGQTVPAVECELNQGESMYTQSGSMIWQTQGIKMSTNARGGLGRSLGRMFTGESIFMANYTAEMPGAKVAFGSTVPGSVVPVNISQGGLICQKGSFLCAEQTVDLKAVFTKKFMSGLFGGEGFILQHLFGQGMAFLEVDGDMVERYLNPGETLKVDTGNVVAFEPTINYEIETVKGLGNIFLGGEGLFLTRLTGPGKIILQTQNFNDFAGRILSMGVKR
ncbi:TIGR00266 family protein [Ruminococcus flavefaciens]|uniref:TIGR00266 family protein n=1 Tax=Ruminococcus flavefaciens TaxID=1265 RepID=UPI0026EDE00B|nr:TIGR00266 family protein [Ruminococcus flavefaciens]MDD7517629.1 TIGR00266 family protein [Ruminococcus flavefaciens]MDY5691319.1 TIGR00266 family protein [Ruminococcus flavefaciens]